MKTSSELLDDLPDALSPFEVATLLRVPLYDVLVALVDGQFALSGDGILTDPMLAPFGLVRTSKADLHDC